MRNKYLLILPFLLITILFGFLQTTFAVSPTPNPNYFQGEYFDNQNFSGVPKLVRLDSKINFILGNGSAASVIPSDHFSARWTRTKFIAAGKYSFTLKADDGIRFFVDNTLVVDDMTNHAMRTYTPDILVNAGNHTFKIQYFENTGSAVAILNEDFPARNRTFPLPLPIPNPPPIVGAALGNYTKPTGTNCTINVPFQFNTIQAAINAAVNGNTICVDAGTYNENVRINKSITLAGNGINNPSIINGQTPILNEGASLKIESDNVIVEGFVIKGIGPDYQNAALRIGEFRSNETVQYNHIIAGNGGVALLTDGFQSNNLIENNILEGKNSPHVAAVNGTPNVAKASIKVDFLNNTFVGTVAPTERNNSGTVLTQQAINSLINKNVFDATGATYGIIDAVPSVINFNNINTDTIIKVRGSGINAENNWWGDNNPSDNVSGDVDFTPFETIPFTKN